MGEFDSGSYASFRQLVVWRYFDSSRQFWESFEAELKSFEGCGYNWEIDLPDLSTRDCLALMESSGEEFGAKLARMVLDVYGNEEKFCSRTSDRHYDHWSDKDLYVSTYQ